MSISTKTENKSPADQSKQSTQSGEITSFLNTLEKSDPKSSTLLNHETDVYFPDDRALEAEQKFITKSDNDDEGLQIESLPTWNLSALDIESLPDKPIPHDFSSSSIDPQITQSPTINNAALSLGNKTIKPSTVPEYIPNTKLPAAQSILLTSSQPFPVPEYAPNTKLLEAQPNPSSASQPIPSIKKQISSIEQQLPSIEEKIPPIPQKISSPTQQSPLPSIPLIEPTVYYSGGTKKILKETYNKVKPQKYTEIVIHPSYLCAGMILSRDLVSDQDTKLLQKGSVILLNQVEGIKKFLKRHQLDEVYVLKPS